MKKYLHNTPTLTFLLCLAFVSHPLGSQAADGTWTDITVGPNNWSNSLMWNVGTIGDGSGFTANFTSNITAATTVNLDISRTIGNMVFSDNGSSNSAWIVSGANTLTLDGGATSTITTTTDATISSVLAGTNSLTKAGAGRLTLSGANTYSGGTVMSGGSITVSNAAALGTAAVSVTGNSALTVSVASGFSNNIAVDSGVTLSVNGGFNNISGVISGAGNVAATNSIHLRGTNTYTGNTSVSAGFLSIDKEASLGATPGAFNAASLTISAGGSLSNYIAAAPVSLNANRGITLTTGNTGGFDVVGQTLTVNGVITGGGRLTKSGTNVLILTAANSYSGGTVINTGTISLGTGGILADTSNAGALSGGDVTINTGGTLRLWIQNNNSYTIANNLIINGGTLRGEDGIYNLTGTVLVGASGANLTTQWATKNLTFSNVVSGAGPITVSSANQADARVILSGANTFTGAVTVATGTLSVGSLNSVVGGTSSSSLGAPTSVAAGTIALGSGTATPAPVLRYSGSGETTDRVINLAGTTSGATIDQSGTGLLRFNSALTATGVGSKTLTLSGSTAGTGEVAGAIVNNATTGSTSLAATFVSGATTVTLASVAGLVANTSTLSGTGITGSVIITAINPTTRVVTLQTATTGASGAAGSSYTSAGLQNTTSLTKSGTGTWALSGTNTYTGATAVTGGMLQFTKQTALYNNTSASWTAANLTVNSGAIAAFNVGGTGEFTAADINTLQALTNVASGVSATQGFRNGSIIGIDTTNASSGTFIYGSILANHVAGATIDTLGLSKLGTGTLQLTALNTYTGGTTVNGGTLDLAIGGATGAIRGTLTANSGAVLRVGVADGLGTVSGTRVTNTTLNGGTIDIQNTGNNSITSALITMAGATITGMTGSKFDLRNNGAGFTNVTTNASATTSVISVGTLGLPFNDATFTVASGTTVSGIDLQITSSIINNAGTGGSGSGTSSLTKAGAGTLVLSNAGSSFTGNVTVNGGVLQTGTTTNGTNSVGYLGANNSTTRVLTINSGSRVDFLRNNVFSGGGNTLANIVTVNINGGTLTSNNYNILGNLTLSNGAILTQSVSNISTAQGTYQGFEFKSGSSITVSGTSASSITASSTGANHLTGTVTFDVSDVTSNSATDLTVSSRLINGSGDNNAAGALVKTGAGTLALSGTNSYSGDTNANVGTINLANINALQSSALNLNGGSVVFDSSATSNAFTLGGLKGSGNLSLENNAGAPAAVALTVGGNNASNTYSGILSGSGSLLKSGTGTQTLTGPNTFSGSATVSTGVLSIGDGGTTGSLVGVSVFTVATGARLTVNRSDALTLAQDITGAGAVQKEAAGTLTFSTVKTYTGGTTVNGGVLDLTIGGGTGAIRGTLTVNSGAAVRVSAAEGLGTVSGTRVTNTTLNGGTIDVQNTGNNSITSALITMTGATITGMTGSKFDLRNNGAGFTNVTTSASATTSVISVGTLGLPNNDATFTIASGTTASGIDLQITSSIVNNAGSNGNGSGTSSLIKAGAGTLQLSGTNTYTGDTNANLGTINLASINALQSSALNLNGGSVVFDSSVTGNAFTFGGLKGSGNLTLENNAGMPAAVALTVGGNNASNTYSGILSGSGSLLKSGTGTQTLTGPSTFSGSTTVSAGVLSLGDGGTTGSLASVSAFTVATGARLTVNRSDAVTLAQDITGAGAVQKEAAGTLTFSTVKTYTGGTTVNGGMLDLTIGGATGAIREALTVNSGATVRVSAAGGLGSSQTLRVTNTTLNGGTLDIQNTGNNSITTALITMTGATITGMTGSKLDLRNNGAGNTNVTSLASATTSVISVGTVGLPGNNAIFTVATGTTATGVDLLINSTIVNNAGTGGAGTGTSSLTKAGTGTLQFSGANTYTGTTTITGGALSLTSTGTTGTGVITAQTGSTILGTGTVRGSSFTAESGSAIHAGNGTAQSNYGTLNFTPASGSGIFDFRSGSTTLLGITPGGTSDLLNFVGTGTNNLLFNGNLTIGPAAFTPVTTETFNLLDWAGLSSTTFDSRYSAGSYSNNLFGNGDDNLGFDLPDISGSGFYWDISQFITNGTISVSVVPEPSRTLLLLCGAISLVLRRRK